jgi:hypothetical protein
VDDVDDLDIDDLDDLDEEEEESKPKAKGGRGKKTSGIGAKAVAEKLGAEPKTFRAWLRRKVAEGAFPGLAEREFRQRYQWANWKDPELVEIMKAWKSDSHTRGGRKKKEDGEAPKKKASGKRKPAAKKGTRRTTKKS